MKKNHDTLVSNVLLILIAAATLILLILFFSGAEWGEKKEMATAPPVVEKNTVQAQKNEPEATEATTTDRCAVVVKKNVKEAKKAWKCPVCGAPAEPDSLCKHCREPYTRLWGYGFTRCWKTADGIEWETETAPACGCMPDEVCDFCRDKINHGWKSSGEVKYYEYFDFLKEKGLPMYEAVHPDKPVKKCKKQVVKKMEEVTIKEEVNDVQDDNGQDVQQQDSSETEAGGEAEQLENINSCSGDSDNCGAADNVDDVKNLQEEKK